MVAGETAESLATLDHVLASPGISPGHRVRYLVLAARTRSNRGQFEEADRVASSAVAAAFEAGDNGALGWALMMMAAVTAARGDLADGLSYSDQALAATKLIRR